MQLNGIFYKEWLKVKWTVLGSLLLLVLLLVYMFINVMYDIKFSSGSVYWNSILFKSEHYYHLLKFIPLLIGLAIAMVQFIPETVDKRLKLTLHLPIRENTALLGMLAFGSGIVVAISLFQILMFFCVSLVFFPIEIVKPAIISLLVWNFAGILAYLWMIFVLVEPVWKKRILYSLVGITCTSMFLVPASMGATLPSIPYYMFIMAASFPAMIFGAWRFRKGSL